MNISIHIIQDESRLKPREKGLNDPRLGSIDRAIKCATVCLRELHQFGPYSLCISISSAMKACLSAQDISATSNLLGRCSMSVSIKKLPLEIFKTADVIRFHNEDQKDPRVYLLPLRQAQARRGIGAGLKWLVTSRANTANSRIHDSLMQCEYATQRLGST